MAEADVRAVQAETPDLDQEEMAHEPAPEDPGPVAPAADLNSPPPSPKKKRKRYKKKASSPPTEEPEQSSPVTRRLKVDHPSTSDQGTWGQSIPADEDEYHPRSSVHVSDEEEEEDRIRKSSKNSIGRERNLKEQI